MDTLIGLTKYMLVLLVLAFAVGDLGANVWYLDILSHFRPYYLVIFGIVLIPYVIADQGKSLIIVGCIIAAVIGISKVAKSFMYEYLPDSMPKSVVGAISGPLQVIAFNVYAYNRTPQALAGYLDITLRPGMPHILFLSETDENWTSHLEEIKKTLPYAFVKPDRGIFGLSLFSDLAPTEVKAVPMDSLGNEAITALFNLNGKELLVIGVHPMPPIDEKGFTARNEYFRNVRKLVNSSKKPTIVMGDFNSSPWSDNFKHFAAPAGREPGEELFDAGDSYLRKFTWNFGVAKLGLPIDFILYTKDLVKTEYYVGPSLGSDHRPIITVFQ